MIPSDDFPVNQGAGPARVQSATTRWPSFAPSVPVFAEQRCGNFVPEPHWTVIADRIDSIRIFPGPKFVPGPEFFKMKSAEEDAEDGA